MTIPLTFGMSWKVPEWQFSLAMKTGSALSECPQMVPRSVQDHGITLCGWVTFFGFALYWHQGLLLDYSKGTGSGCRCFTSFCGVCPLRETGELRNMVIGFLWFVLFLSLEEVKIQNFFVPLNSHMSSWFVFWINKELFYLLIPSHFFVADLGLRSCLVPVWEEIFVLLLFNITAHIGTVGI